MTLKSSASDLHRALLAWPGITSKPGRFGSTVYELEGREVGHIHGASHADLPLPKPLRDPLIESGRAEPHHFLPQSGWVTVPLQDKDVEAVLAVFRLNYDLIAKKKGLDWQSEQG
jgi:hypothetical protein